MHKLMGNKNMEISAPKQPIRKEPVNVAPTNCLLFSNMFDASKIDLKKEPAYFIDIKEQVKMVCADFGQVNRVYIE